MSSKQLKMIMMVLSGLVVLFGLETLAYAASGSGVAAVAVQAKKQLGDIAKLITAGSYVGGFGFAVAAIVKFKAHKEQPTQVPISAAIVPLFVAAAMLFIPSVYSSAAHTLYQSGTAAGISGVQSF